MVIKYFCIEMGFLDNEMDERVENFFSNFFLCMINLRIYFLVFFMVLDIERKLGGLWVWRCYDN